MISSAETFLSLGVSSKAASSSPMSTRASPRTRYSPSAISPNISGAHKTGFFRQKKLKVETNKQRSIHARIYHDDHQRERRVRHLHSTELGSTLGAHHGQHVAMCLILRQSSNTSTIHSKSAVCVFVWFRGTGGPSTPLSPKRNIYPIPSPTFPSK